MHIALWIALAAATIAMPWVVLPCALIWWLISKNSRDETIVVAAPPEQETVYHKLVGRKTELTEEQKRNIEKEWNSIRHQGAGEMVDLHLSGLE